MASVWHNGTVPAFNSKMVLVPDRRWGVVILSNASSQLGRERIEGIVDGVISLMLGQPPAAPPANSVVVVIVGVIAGLVGLLLLGIVRSVIALRTWRGQPGRRPHGWRGVAWHVGVPCALNVLLALIFLQGTAQLFGISLGSTMLLSPDIGAVVITSGVLAAAWAVILAVLAVSLLRADKRESAFGAKLPAVA